MNDLSVRTTDVDYVWRIRDSYTANAGTFHRFLESNEFGLVDGLAPYFEWLENQNYHASTVRIKRQAALDRVRRMVSRPGAFTKDQQEKIGWMITETVKNRRAPKLVIRSPGREKLLSLEDFRKTMAVAKSERQRAFLRLLFITGARVSEITGIRRENCETVAGTVYARVLGKGKRERYLRLTAKQFEEIAQVFNGQTYLFETSNGKPYTRQYISGELRKLTRRALGRSLSAHKLRHSFATRQIGNGVPVDAVSRYLGHASVSTTLTYYSHNEMTDAQLFDEDL